MMKRPLGIDVYTAATQRIAWAFDHCARLYVSFSGGKDSTVMLHMVMTEAAKRGRTVGVLFLDLEGQYALTIDHVSAMYARYREQIERYWVCLPIQLRNAVSVFAPHWRCWDPDERNAWVRQPPERAITDPAFFPFFRSGMEFEEFVPQFGQWYGQRQVTGCFVGIRADESLNRYRAVARRNKVCYDHVPYTTWITDEVYNVYPLYDWKTEDIWTFHARTGLPYNPLYDRMYQAGVPLRHMRICQPYGDDQRRGLWLFHAIEPDTWAKIVARVQGANGGARYGRESGNIMGHRRITKPPGHTWESFAHLLLDSLPPPTREHYANKIAVFLHWWAAHGYPVIPDAAEPKLESAGAGKARLPSWRRICKVLLSNDYWCKGLSFSPTKSTAYQRYRTLMKERRRQWNILS